MSIDLSTLSDDDLEALKPQIDKELAKRATQKKAEARKALEQTAKEYGFSLQELLAAKAAGSKAAGVAKFANPDDPSQTWTGKGRQPGWYKAAIEAGKSPDDLAI